MALHERSHFCVSRVSLEGLREKRDCRPVAGGGEGGGLEPPPEIFRLVLNSAAKVEFFFLKWTAVNGS